MYAPQRGLGLQPRGVPRPGTEHTTFSLPLTEPQQPGQNYPSDGSVKCAAPPESHLAAPQLHSDSPRGRGTPPPNTHSGETRTHSHKTRGTGVHSGIPDDNENTRPLRDGRTKGSTRMQWTVTGTRTGMECRHAITWLNRENTLSERSQVQKTTHMIPFT